MKKLMLSTAIAAVLAAAAPLAMADAESQAGSAWRNQGQNGPAYGTPEYYGNSGWPPPAEQQAPNAYYPRGYDQRAYDQRAYDQRAYGAYPYGYDNRQYQATRRDRDGDGVRNNRDRYPDDPRRW